MKLFFIKFLLIASLMFVCVLFGMQQANEGIHRMKGYQDEGFKETLNVEKNSDGELEVSLLGNDLSSHDLEKKKEKLEEIKAYNFFSSMGKKLADGLSAIAETVIKAITNFLNQ